jgi:hypothetical protein
MPAGKKTLRMCPPHATHVSSGGSAKRWKISTCCPQLVQAYSYVGMNEV